MGSGAWVVVGVVYPLLMGMDILFVCVCVTDWVGERAKETAPGLAGGGVEAPR